MVILNSTSNTTSRELDFGMLAIACMLECVFAVTVKRLELFNPVITFFYILNLSELQNSYI